MPLCRQYTVDCAGALRAVVAATLFVCLPRAGAATYSYYFANSGRRGAPCSRQRPGADTSDAQERVESAGPTDTVHLYFKRGDTWRFDTAAEVNRQVFGLAVSNDDPIVHIDAYGSGSKPVFDGMVSDWTTVPSHNRTTGPLRWNSIVGIRRPNCSVKNLEIRNVYGIGISLGKNHDGATVSGCDIHHFGESAIRNSWHYNAQDITIEHCLVHTGQLLFQYDKMHGTGWAATPNTTGTSLLTEASVSGFSTPGPDPATSSGRSRYSTTPSSIHVPPISARAVLNSSPT